MLILKAVVKQITYIHVMGYKQEVVIMELLCSKQPQLSNIVLNTYHILRFISGA